jgi:hypothetical protein
VVANASGELDQLGADVGSPEPIPAEVYEFLTAALTAGAAQGRFTAMAPGRDGTRGRVRPADAESDPVETDNLVIMPASVLLRHSKSAEVPMNDRVRTPGGER